MKNEMDGKKILVVEDEPFMRSTIKQMLRVVAQFNVRDAADGELALEILSTFPADLVLCDVRMAPMSGVEFVGKLRQHADERIRATRVVMLTVDDGHATMSDVARFGISGYLLKPVSPKALGQRLRSVLVGESRSREAAPQPAAQQK